VATFTTTGAHADDDEDLGLELVPYSRKVGEHRYESQRDYEGTLKFFKDKFKGQKQVRFFKEVSVPAVKYTHIENSGSSGEWAGVNVAVTPNGRVRYFILDKKGAPTPAAAPAKGAAPTRPAPAKPPKATSEKP
jgi:hypothetical protein